MDVSFPHPGVQEWTNPNGIHIFQLHYDADEYKSSGQKIWNERQKAWLSPWADAMERSMTDPAMFQQEFNISFTAKLGALLFQLRDEATLEKSFPIPKDWTRCMALDPHPRVPHAFLWGATDPWGDRWIYREMWPSKVYGIPGNTPEDDNRYRIRDYVETVKFLESSENSENQDKPEKIYKRVIDYAARGFVGLTDDADQRNIQQRYEDESAEQGYHFAFSDAIKDRDAGVECVNDWLKPLEIEQGGKLRQKSRLHIFQDKCPELIHELKNNRWEGLSPLMAERSDPLAKPMKKRNHMTDCLRYYLMEDAPYIGDVKPRDTWKPLHKGIAY